MEKINVVTGDGKWLIFQINQPPGNGGECSWLVGAVGLQCVVVVVVVAVVVVM